MLCERDDMRAAAHERDARATLPFFAAMPCAFRFFRRFMPLIRAADFAAIPLRCH